MNHRCGLDRAQTLLFPERLEDYVQPENPVRFLDAFVEKLDLAALDFTHATCANTGRPPYAPAMLLKLYLYGYLHRLRSSRVLEAECLRNVELTGPYFHNGGKATLMQVIDHYDRGGDFGVDNVKNLSPAIVPLGFTEQEKTDLVSFLLSLTDDRVRMERAPFDHPSICVANGHVQSSLTTPVGLNAVDDMMCLDAVGSEGRTPPITPFLELSPYQH